MRSPRRCESPGPGFNSRSGRQAPFHWRRTYLGSCPRDAPGWSCTGATRTWKRWLHCSDTDDSRQRGDDAERDHVPRGRGAPARYAGGGSAASRDPNAATRAPARTCSWSAPTLDINKTPRSQRLRRDFAGTPTSRLSLKAQSFTESVIREMTRLNLQLNGAERAVNFAQGFPDFNTDARILEAAAGALRGGYHQAAATRGAPRRRQR